MASVVIRCVRATTLAATIMFGAALAARSAPEAATFSSLVVFGDSLSDSGNAGRFSDGPVWVEFLAHSIGFELRPSRAGGTNYAVGGARSHGGRSDIRGQLHAYMTAGPAPASDTLFVVYGGANDILGHGCHNRGNAITKTAAAAIAASVNDLATAGAHTILVPNLPNIGIAPAIQMQGRDCIRETSRLVQDFNGALEKALRAVETRHDIRIVRFDVFALGEHVMADPHRSGFADVARPCVSGSCEGVLFWDPLHPTSQAHALLAEAAERALGISSPE